MEGRHRKQELLLSGFRADASHFLQIHIVTQRNAVQRQTQTVDRRIIMWFTFKASSLLPIQASLLAQTGKNLPAMEETCVQSLGWEDPLEKGMANYSGILAWEIP